MTAPLYRCRKCQRELPRTSEHFGPHNKTKDGLHSYCRQCVNAAARDKRANAAPKPRAGLSIRRRALKTPWASWEPSGFSGRRAAGPSGEPPDETYNLAPLETRLVEVAPDVMRARHSPHRFLGDE